ncbi:MAG: hypothetical protein DDT23_00880 [candidate division WS2 bacterium]|nr:hypothetical protein [Candidatus Lithacetigena glycinireducens]
MTDSKTTNYRDLNLILDEIWDLEEAVLLHKGLIEKYPLNLELNTALRISLELAEVRRNDLVADLRSTSCGDEPEDDRDLHLISDKY